MPEIEECNMQAIAVSSHRVGHRRTRSAGGIEGIGVAERLERPDSIVQGTVDHIDHARTSASIGGGKGERDRDREREIERDRER